MSVQIFTTGGTIDKIYFDAKNEFQVGEPQISEVLQNSNVTVPFSVQALMRRDSLEMGEEDRQIIYDAVVYAQHSQILITHGTDKMATTAESLQGIKHKTVVLTGAMQPARFRQTDVIFNIASAFAAVQILPAGIYISMNGRIFQAGKVRKNLNANCFESL